MPFSSGVYTLPNPALVTGEVVSATENNSTRNDLAGALNLTFLRNGTSTATANLPMGGYKLTGLGAGTANGDSARYEQVTSAVAITGGTINGATIGASTASTGAFTTLSASGAVTISSGTANGVAYLNGSKVLTTGSALTFDGSGLKVGATGYPYITSSGYYVDGGYAAYITGTTTSGGFSDMVFNVRSAEGMRLTSTGLGIGTSSPVLKLDVAFSSAGDGIRTYNTLSTGFADVRIGNNSNNNLGFIRVGGSAQGGIYQDSLVVGTGGGYPIKIAPQASVAATFDTSGNLGLGVTPSAWNTFNAIQMLGGGVSIASGSGQSYMGSNWYFASGNKYYANGYATRYDQTNGQHIWQIAPSGTAGNAISFTQAMTLDASGVLTVNRTGNGNAGVFTNGSTSAAIYTGSSGITFGDSAGNNQAYILPGSNVYTLYTGGSERMRIDSSGNVGIGTSSPNSPAGSTQTTLHVNNSTAGTSPGIHLTNGDTGTAAGDGTLIFVGNAASTGTTSLNVYNQESSPICFFTATSERMRIDSSGNVLVGTTSAVDAGKISLAYASASTNGMVIRDTSGLNGAPAIKFQSNTTAVGSITTTSSATAYNTSSDYRLKENIQPMQGALERNALLKPCTYSWKADGSVGEGFIAHELQAVCPDAVTGEKDAVDKDGKPVYQGVDTSFLVGHLVACIQELKAELDATKAEVAALKGN